MILMPNGLRHQRETITESEMDWLAKGEHMCRKLQVTIICQKCKQTLQGQNDESDATITVSCPCSEKVFHQAV